MSANDPAGSRLTLRSVAVAVSVAVGLTVVFWQPLYRGGGFVGGDVYSYYLPQKDLFAERVRAGEVPLWHSRTGFGYPLVGESQTGVFYPPNWLLYVPLELNRAFNASHLLHYVLAFVFVWLYARRLKLRQAAALLAALVYVYGWFPPRCSLEWAIVGGTWLPAALWQAESFVAAGRRSSLAGLAVVLGLQLLAGHFSLAFITLLTVWLYVPLRLWLAPRDLAERDPSPGRTVRATGLVTLAMAAAFLLAAAQLAPTWQLKTASQRDEVSEEHDPAYGHMPPLYVTQLVASWWYWYAEDIDTDQALRDMKFLASSARTNRVEAHLYFGLLPLILVLLSLLRGRPFRRGPEAVWAILGGLALVYTTGWLIPLTRHLPGFSFFEGPARYGVVTTLAAGCGSSSQRHRRTFDCLRPGRICRTCAESRPCPCIWGSPRRSTSPPT